MAENIRKILVGYDGSAEAEAAMLYACKLATGLGADLMIVTVKNLPVHVAGYFDEKMKAKMDEHYQRIADGAANLCGDCGVCSKAHVIEGHPAEAIATFAKEHGADLIVVGSRPVSGLVRYFTGSTAGALIHMAPCPVLVHR